MEGQINYATGVIRFGLARVSLSLIWFGVGNSQGVCCLKSGRWKI